MTGREAARRWEAARRRLRERAAHLTPRVLTHYPFEVLAALIAILMGLPTILGATPPASLLLLVGAVPFYAWSSALVLGGLTVAAGLHIGNRPNPVVTATGLQLTAGCFGIYALAVVAVLGLGWDAIPVFAVYIVLSILSLIRATHFRRIVDIQRGASQAAGKPS